MSYLDTLNKRRSVYALTKDLTVPADDVVKLVEDVIVASPSAFNMQSARAVVLLGDEHKALWDIVTNVLKQHVPADQFTPTQDKMNMFAAGAGTIMFFDDDAVIDSYKQQFAKYASAFDMFAAHGLGIAQGNVWNALAELGIGANLQHYNPIIDADVKARWNLPESWRLVSQMVFGGVAAEPEPKDKLAASERVRVFR